jgi:hypothetical protein
MVRKNTWLVLIFFIVFSAGTWLYFLYLDNPKEQVVSTTFNKLLPGVSVDNIKSISYQDSQGTAVILSKGSGSTLVQENPIINLLSQGNISEIISQLTAITILTELPYPPTTIDMGLDNPACMIKITTGQEYVLKIGTKTPIESGYYAQVDQDSPVIISIYGIDRIIEIIEQSRMTPTP